MAWRLGAVCSMNAVHSGANLVAFEAEVLAGAVGIERTS